MSESVVNTNEEPKNKNDILCPACDSVILKANKGLLSKDEFKLPIMNQKNAKTSGEIETETLCDYWMVEDMFTFENIGFSNTVGSTKYLICAECEIGPIGYHDIVTKKSYIAVKRVKI